MTGRERIVAAARGGPVDRLPVIGSSANADGRVIPLTQLTSGGDSAVLGDVLSPLGRALENGIPVVSSLVDDPDAGHRLLEDLVAQTRDEIEKVLGAGGDGVFYRLRGADPSTCTPMEYGGYFLERDRELLEEIAEARLNVVYIDSPSEPYLDFVSDLPAHVFAWDANSTDMSLSDVRKLRQGSLCTQSEEADILLDLEPEPLAGSLLGVRHA